MYSEEQGSIFRRPHSIYDFSSQKEKCAKSIHIDAKREKLRMDS